ncbi:MAG: HipA domain-containing protein [Candidatus Latescibacteria bacterium]|nr:HipA domain-containing protein [Candidatus Latescibacterota bacterium]
MSDAYPIVIVEPEWVITPEEMGGKTKFWYGKPDDNTNWLFKYPRPNTGEHGAEKIAAEVAAVIGTTHAKVELAQFQGERGSVTESFARGDRVLHHGNQMLEVALDGYNPNQKFRQSSHTLANIWKVMDAIFLGPESAKQAKLIIAEYTVLDALIGNTDRHHENWGILRRRAGGEGRGFIAPSYDHASSLGRELRDERRDRLMAENRIGDYAERGRGAIYWSEDERHGPSPLELVRCAAPTYPDLFHPALAKLQKLDEDSISTIVNRVPDNWMSPAARTFAIALMCYNFEQLGEMIQ